MRRRLFTSTLTAAVAAFCLGAPGPAAADDDHHHHHGVVLYPHTHIAGPGLRKALTAYDPSTGVMHFAREEGAMSLKPGDVLVSEPSAAAPYGYLRRITAVTRSKAEVLLATVPARLDEAIKDGHATATVILPAGSGRTPTIVPGGLVFPAALKSAAGIGTSNSLDVEYHDKDIDLSAHGHETAWVGINLSVDIDAACLIDGDPCFSFDAEAGIQDDTAIAINGAFHTTFSKSFDLVDETFDPIVFAIGPVPVVLVPKLSITFDFNGSAQGTFAYAGEANGPEYRMSVHWDSGNGFSNGFSEKPAHIDPGSIDLVADVDVHARLPTTMQLLLYDLAGVNAVVTAGLDAKLHIPHKPRWSVDGLLTGEIGVNASLPIIGDLGSSEVTLFDEQFHVSESVNNPPRISILTPVDGQQVSLTWPDFGQLTLFAQTADDEDGTPCCTVDWRLSNGTALARGNDLAALLPGAGHFDLIARATDSDGAGTDSAPIGLDVVIPPAGSGIALPGVACESKIYTNLPQRLLGRDGEFIGALPYTCVWFSDNAADQPQFPPGEEIAGTFDRNRGCELDTFFPTSGVRTLTLSVVPVAPDGSTGNPSFSTKALRVLDPPAGAIPLLREPGPAACEQVLLDSTKGTVEAQLELSGGAAQVALTWQAGSCAPVPLPVHRLFPGVCGPGYCPTPYLIKGVEVAAVTPAACGGDSAFGTVTVTATDANGAVNSTLFSIRLFNQIVK